MSLFTKRTFLYVRKQDNFIFVRKLDDFIFVRKQDDCIFVRKLDCSSIVTTLGEWSGEFSSHSNAFPIILDQTVSNMYLYLLNNGHIILFHW